MCGYMSEALKEFFLNVYSTDIFDYGFGNVADFLHEDYAIDLIG